MQRLINRLREQPDRGASAVVVAIVLLVLFGFAGLGVDVTSAYAKSQEVQNAADAAALATAQHCAQEDVVCTDGSESGPATSLAQENVRRQVDTVEALDAYPTSNRVTVEVTAEHQNFFAGLFGFNSFTVVREATALWQTPTEGPAIIPLTISMCSFLEQSSELPNLGDELEIWQPQGGGGQGGGGGGEGAPHCGWHDYYPPGGFGWLDPDDETTCEVDIVLDDGTGEPSQPGEPGMDPPNCIDVALAPLQDGPMTVLLPIFDAEAGDGNNAMYRLVRFAALELQGVEFQTTSNIPTGFSCHWPKPDNPDGVTGKYYSDTCLRGTFVEWVELEDDYDGDEGEEESEVSVIRLIDPEYEDSL